MTKCKACGSERTSLWRLTMHRDDHDVTKICWRWHCQCGVGVIDYAAEIDTGLLLDRAQTVMRVADAMDREFGHMGHLKMLIMAALADAMNMGVDQAIQDSDSIE